VAGNATGRVQFVVNFEEGGEKHSTADRASEAFLSDVLGAQPGPKRHANINRCFCIRLAARAYGGYGGCHERQGCRRRYSVSRRAENEIRKMSPPLKEAGWGHCKPQLKWVEHKDMSEARRKRA